jgi:5S rRNA maturation endonuclease (ribonuclease M5)/replicative DNA helicase
LGQYKDLPPGSVEKYLKYKGWDYRLSGNQAQIEQCQFCLSMGYKFFINVENGLFDCKKGACGKRGNLYQLMDKLGDRDQMPKRSTWNDEDEEVTAAHKGKPIDGIVDIKSSGEKKREKIPNVEQFHEDLLANNDVMNYLADERGWDYDTIVKMKIGIAQRDIEIEDGQYKSLTCVTYPYFTGKACNFVKFRTLPTTTEGVPEGFKGFSSVRGWDVPLYNSSAVKKGMEYLILVEGEADTLSVLQLGEENVAGVPGVNNVKITWDQLMDIPKKKYLLFDNDEAGQVGAQKFAERFGNVGFYNIVIPQRELLEEKYEDGKTRTVSKDVGEWITAGGTLEELHQLMEDARQFDIEGVSSIDSALDELERFIAENGSGMKYDSPWAELNNRMGGAEDGHLIILQAPEKSGKTTAALNWGDFLCDRNGYPAYDDDGKLIPWASKPHPLNENVYFECMEMKPVELSRKWVAFKTQTNDDSGKGKSQITTEVIREGKRIMRARSNYMLFGIAEYDKLDEVFERWKTIVRRYGVKVFIFDNLQALADTLWSGERMGNRPAFMSRITKKIKQFALAHNLLFLLLAQSKRTDGISNSDSLEGSGSPAKDCDTMITANRAKTNTAKNVEELDELVEMENESAQTPIIYMDVGLSRHSKGGACKLYLEGEMSTVRDLKDSEKASAQTAAMAAKSSVSWQKGQGKPAKKAAVAPVVHVDAISQSGEAVTP